MSASCRTHFTSRRTTAQDDTIKLVQGTYTDTFIFSSMEEHSLTLLGGYTAGCAARVINPANTILDGDNTGPVLVLKSNSASHI